MIRKLWVKKVSGICRAAKAAGEILKTCLVPYSHSFILELITLGYVTFLVLMEQVRTFVMLMFMLVLMLMSQCKLGLRRFIVLGNGAVYE